MAAHEEAATTQSSSSRAWWWCVPTTATLRDVRHVLLRHATALRARLAVPSADESMAGVIILFVFTNSVATSIWMFNAWSPFIYTLTNGSNVYVGLMAAINGAFELSVAFVSGHVADKRVGPSRMLRMALCFGLVTMLVVLLAAWSGRLALLMLAQACEGTYMGLSFTNVESAFAQCLRRGERDRLYSVKFSLEAAGPMVGVVLSIVLYAVAGNAWRVSVLRWVLTCGLLLHVASIVTFLARFKPMPPPLATVAAVAAAAGGGEGVASSNAADADDVLATSHVTDDNKRHHDDNDNDSSSSNRRSCGACVRVKDYACEDKRVVVVGDEDEALTLSPHTPPSPSSSSSHVAATAVSSACASELANRARTAMLSECRGGATMAVYAMAGAYNPSVCTVTVPSPMAVDEAVAAAAANTRDDDVDDEADKGEDGGVHSCCRAGVVTAEAAARASSCDSDSDTHKTSYEVADEAAAAVVAHSTAVARVLHASFYSTTQFGGGCVHASSDADLTTTTTMTTMTANAAASSATPPPLQQQQPSSSATTTAHATTTTHATTTAASSYIVGYVDTELQKARGLRRRVLLCLPLTRYPLLIVLVDLILIIGSGMTTQYLSLFMMHVYGVSPILLAVLNLLNSLLISMLAIVNGYAGQRWGRVRAMLPTKLLGCALLLWMALGNGRARPRVLMCVAFVLRNACMNCSAGLSRALIMDIVPAHRRGRWNAVESVQSAGWSGTAFIGGFIADRYSYGASFIFTFAFHMTACVLLLPLTLRNDSRLPQPVYATTTEATSEAATRAAAATRVDDDNNSSRYHSSEANTTRRAYSSTMRASDVVVADVHTRASAVPTREGARRGAGNDDDDE